MGMKKQILRKAFPEWSTDGCLFRYMTGMPWSQYVDGSILDFMYFGERSGDKFCSNIVYIHLDDNGEVTAAGKLVFANILKVRFGKNWLRLWDTYDAEYDPLKDYSFTEHEETQFTADNSEMLTHGKTETVTHNTTDTDTRTDNLLETTENVRTDNLMEESTSTRTDNLTQRTDSDSLVSSYGYNVNVDANGAPRERTVSTETVANTGTQQDVGSIENTGTQRNAGSVANTGTQTEQTVKTGSDTTANSGSDSTNIDKDEQEVRDLTRTGNINRSLQSLIDDERKVWIWDFFGQVFKDVDSMLALKLHEPKVIRKDYVYEGV